LPSDPGKTSTSRLDCGCNAVPRTPPVACDLRQFAQHRGRDAPAPRRSAPMTDRCSPAGLLISPLNSIRKMTPFPGPFDTFPAPHRSLSKVVHQFGGRLKGDRATTTDGRTELGHSLWTLFRQGDTAWFVTPHRPARPFDWRPPRQSLRALKRPRVRCSRATEQPIDTSTGGRENAFLRTCWVSSLSSRTNLRRRNGQMGGDCQGQGQRGVYKRPEAKHRPR